MFNFFEQPWTLFIIAAAILYAVFRFRSISPEKYRWWQWLIPVFIAVSAFGGGLHCATADVYREGTCEDYFPNQISGF